MQKSSGQVRRLTKNEYLLSKNMPNANPLSDIVPEPEAEIHMLDLTADPSEFLIKKSGSPREYSH